MLAAWRIHNGPPPLALTLGPTFHQEVLILLMAFFFPAPYYKRERELAADGADENQNQTSRVEPRPRPRPRKQQAIRSDLALFPVRPRTDIVKVSRPRGRAVE